MTRNSTCARLRLGCDPAVVAEARRAVGRFEPGVPGPVLDSARLVVTELVTNSIVHGIREGDGWVDVTIEQRARCLRIEVSDPASTGLRPVLRPVGPEEHLGVGPAARGPARDGVGGRDRAGHLRLVRARDARADLTGASGALRPHPRDTLTNTRSPVARLLKYRCFPLEHAVSRH